VLGEHGPEVAFSDIEGKVPNVQFCTHDGFLLSLLLFPGCPRRFGFQIITEEKFIEDFPA
jgi:hypothetical protein